MENLDNGNLVYVGPNDDLKTVLSCFKINHISHVPVVSEKKIMGMVSKTDVVEYLYQVLVDQGGESFESLATEIKVKQMMIQPIIQAQVSESQRSILEKMIDHQVSSVVLKDGDKLVGIVTESDMIRFLGRGQKEDLSFSETLNVNLVQWLDENGLFRVSRMLADIGI